MRLRTLRGDTLIEVMLSISVFAVVALLAINMMNDGINTAQRTLETAMARNEIDAQAESLRFIHQSYVAERQKTSNESGFKQLWETIISRANKPSSLEDSDDDLKNGGLTAFDINNMSSCNIAYSSSENGHFAKYHSFVLNTRLVLPDSNKKSPKYMDVNYSDLLNNEIIIEKSRLAEASLYPRLIYKHNPHATDSTDTINMDQGEADVQNLFNLVSSAEGIWIDVAGNNEANPKRSDYFDFYIRTCWQSAGTRVPSTLTTVVRLYNPEVLQ